MKSRLFSVALAVLALTIASFGFGAAGAGAQDNYGSGGDNPPPPAPAPVVVTNAGVESTGHIVTADDGFSSLANGNTSGPTAGQATAITPKQGEVPALAYTGTETAYLAYAGLGLVAAGAIALFIRKETDPFEFEA